MQSTLSKGVVIAMVATVPGALGLKEVLIVGNTVVDSSQGSVLDLLASLFVWSQHIG